jgi:hypothetical protein
VFGITEQEAKGQYEEIVRKYKKTANTPSAAQTPLFLKGE